MVYFDQFSFLSRRIGNFYLVFNPCMFVINNFRKETSTAGLNLFCASRLFSTAQLRLVDNKSPPYLISTKLFEILTTNTVIIFRKLIALWNIYNYFNNVKKYFTTQDNILLYFIIIIGHKIEFHWIFDKFLFFNQILLLKFC